MVPAFVAPLVRGPPSSPVEDRKSVGQGKSVDLGGPRIIKKKTKPSKLPTITVYVPLVGAVAAMSDAPVPVALFPRSTPVGDTSRIQGAKCAVVCVAVAMHRAM